MEFTSSYFHAFGNPDFAAVFSGGDDDGGGSAQARRPLSSADDDAAARVKAAATTSRGPAAAGHAPSMFFVPDVEAEEPRHFLDECTLCHKALCGDIFMYRGDMPFCSDECRSEQIDMDRAKKHRRKKQNNSPTAQQAAAAPHSERRPQRQLQPQR